MNDTSQDIKQVDKHCTAEEFLLNDDNSPQTKMVRKAYNEMDCMFGTYVPHYVPFMVKSLRRLIVTCLAAVLFWTFINAILSSASIGAKIGFAFAMVPVFAFWVYFFFLAMPKKHYVYFFKHNGKLYTIRYNKLRRYLAIRLYINGYYRYNFTKKAWKESDDSLMGPYLLFTRLNLASERGEGKPYCNIRKGLFERTIIRNYSYCIHGIYDYSICVFKNEQLKKIKYAKVLKARKHSEIAEKLKFVETNKIHCIDIPKSLVEFCKECGLDAPIECEHLHYVDMD